jgi:hypothetical protein
MLATAAALMVFLAVFGYFAGKTVFSLWVLVFCLALLPLAYVLQLGNRIGLRIADDKCEITFVPSWYGRCFARAERQSANFTDDSELLFCRHNSYGYFDGFLILLRTPNLPDKILWQTWSSSSGVSRKWWAHLAAEISTGHRLRAQLRSLAITSEGSEEKDWMPTDNAAILKALTLALPVMLAPWFGIVVRIFTGRIILITLAGVLLWVAGGLFPLLALGFGRMFEEQRRPRELTVRLFLWSMQFTVFYILCVLVTGAVLHH